MKRHLRIDFVSDVACPWCAIGLASLTQALRSAADVVEADIHLQPFELNPDMKPGGENIDALLASRYGGDARQLATMRDNVRQRAQSAGLVFNQDGNSRIYNTFDAHRLLHWAKATGRQVELKQALFEANFTDGADVSDTEVLVSAASRAGLDPVTARDVLTSGRHAEAVREAEREWVERGIRSVPAIVIEGRWLISGGQPAEVFEQALRSIAREPA